MQNLSSLKKVIVIGGGMAGVKVAHRLLKANISVTILEISDYIGGRMKCAQFNNQTIEEGANWIQGLVNNETGEENPIWTLAQIMQLDVEEDNFTELAVDATQNGKDVTDEFGEIYDEFEEFDENLKEQLDQKGFNLNEDKNVEEVLREAGWNLNNNNIYNLVQWLNYDVYSGEAANKLSAFYTIAEQKEVHGGFGDDEVFVQDQRGYSYLLSKMVDEIKASEQILFNQKVLEVNYSNGKATVVSKNLVDQQISTFDADAVVCTVSIGVLKNKLINFVPPLPKQKIEAISELNMGIFGKVFMTFQKQFWPDNKQYLYTVCDKKGYFPLITPLKQVGNLPCLCCFIGGDLARRVERQNIEELKKELQEHLYKSFSQFRDGTEKDEVRSNKESFLPQDLHVAKWDTDERFCGSYSQWPVGAFKDKDWEDLVCPLTGFEESDEKNKKPILFFAGEAYSEIGAGYVQGAYLSAQITANQIIKSFK